MGFWETITDLVDAATPWSVADAEAPEETKTEDAENDSASDEASEGKSDDKEEESSEEEPAEEAEEEEEEEEDEDDDEPEDQKEPLEEACKESKQCAPAKHHYDECVERVTGQEDAGGAKEDCVEEFFHLAHCATQCAAPKLWSVLK